MFLNSSLKHTDHTKQSNITPRVFLNSSLKHTDHTKQSIITHRVFLNSSLKHTDHTKQSIITPRVFLNSSLKHTDHTNLDSNPHIEFCLPVRNKRLDSSYPFLLCQYQSIICSCLEIMTGQTVSDQTHLW